MRLMSPVTFASKIDRYRRRYFLVIVAYKNVHHMLYTS